MTRDWLASLILFVAGGEVPRFWVDTSVLVIDLCFFLYYFFGESRFCLKYLHGRVLYYQALSEIVWDHMGITVATQSADSIGKLKDRAVGKNAKGINEAILSLFEARLSVSLWHRRHPNVDLGLAENEELRKQLQKGLRKVKPFAITDDSLCYVGQTYYAQPAPLWRFWNRADLLVLAHRYALKGYRKDVREYVECLEKAADGSSVRVPSEKGHRIPVREEGGV